MQVLRPVPHRHRVFALPKVLRPAFRYRRKPLARLAICARKAVSAFLRGRYLRDALPAAIVSIQTAGEFFYWHPHLHVLTIDGASRFDGTFAPSATFDVATLRELFRADVLRLLVPEGMISGGFVGPIKLLYPP